LAWHVCYSSPVISCGIGWRNTLIDKGTVDEMSVYKMTYCRSSGIILHQMLQKACKACCNQMNMIINSALFDQSIAFFVLCLCHRLFISMSLSQTIHFSVCVTNYSFQCLGDKLFIGNTYSPPPLSKCNKASFQYQK